MNKNQNYNIKKDIKRFHLKDLKEYATTAIIGIRGSGKTVIIKYILYYNYKKIRIPVLISSTAQMEEDFKGVVPDIYTFENYDPDKINILIRDQWLLKKKIDDGHVSSKVKKNSYLIMDDIVGTDPAWKKDMLFKRTFFAGRHYWLSNIISVQTPMQNPAEYRDNIDYIIVTAITTDKRKKFFYENFWNSRFGNFRDFCDIFDTIMSEKYNFMLIDNKSAKRGDCDSVNKYVYWGKTHDPKNLISKPVGLDFIWELNKKYYNEDWIMKHTLNNVNMNKKDKNKERQQIELVDNKRKKKKKDTRIIYKTE
jgi:hypothetical protein